MTYIPIQVRLGQFGESSIIGVRVSYPPNFGHTDFVSDRLNATAFFIQQSISLAKYIMLQKHQRQ